ncbi:MAG TPA: ureidoglycolate lyase [Burkholderiaceae bacterium]|nr:ureidoglycolate lyase [Burkholderiaceae bacterium]
MTTTTTLLIEPLTRAAFAPFGDVIEATDDVLHFSINDGNTERYHDLAHIDPGPDGRAIVSLFRGQPRTLPFDVVMMERHPRASQAFIPLSGRPYLAVVAAPGDPPAAGDLRVFLCQANQGVNYARGVWHHPLLALEQISDFLVIDRSGPGDNCDVITLDEGALIPALHARP